MAIFAAVSNKPRKRRPTGPLSRSEEDAYNDYVRHFRRNVLPKMQNSTFVTSLLPDSGGLDVKFATEFGAAIMLGKPILAIAAPGRPVPEGVRKVATVLETDADIDTPEGAAQISEMLGKFVDGLED